ncbi:MAG: KH domain-containing protein [Candidatus Saccharibacteria bacterium]|nr:KH domain-containing protein [Candidatus Saccharibacteria bacterium]
MATSIDQQFIEFIVKSLVGKPDSVEIKRTIDEKGVLLELTVDPEDLGRVIGKRGATAQSLRTLLRALGTKNDARYNLKIVDNGEERPVRKETPEDDQASDKDEPRETKETESESEATESEDFEEAESTGDNDTSETPEDEDENSSAARTRKELADLDDLDI